MKILGIFLNNEIRTGGHTRYLELLNALADRGNEVVAIVNADLTLPSVRFNRLDISLRYRKGRRFLLGQRFAIAAQRALRVHSAQIRGRCDFVLVFGETHWGAARTLSNSLSIPVMFAFRSDAILEKTVQLSKERPSLLPNAILRLALIRDRQREHVIAKKAQWIVFQSRFDLGNFIARNPAAAHRCHVIRGDIRQPRFRPELALTNDSRTCERLLFIGTLNFRKGLKYLLEALALVRSRNLNMTLDIIAPGKNFDRFSKIIERLGIGAFVRYHGKIADPLPYIRDSDLLVVPSLFDSYPNTVLEALHVGLPVIGSDTGGISDMLGNPSLLFSPGSADAIATILCALNQNPGEYLRAREYCLNRRSYFDFDWAEQWEAVVTGE